jgi:glutaconate CoA-transferase, subunit A
LKQGVAELFSNLDIEEYREFFRNKNKKQICKITTVKQAISEHVQNGDYIAIGGFGCNRIPTSLLHEIVKQGKKDLGLSGHTATHDGQILAAGECFNRADIAYVVGLEARGLSKNYRKMFESGKVKCTEWSNAALAWRYKAAAMGIPFMPARVLMGTDTFTYSAAKEIECPFTKKKLLALPALYPDVALIHVHRADKYGNCQIDGIIMSDNDLCKASKRVIITTEKLISNEEIREDPNKTIIPFWCVDAVIEVPGGSYPGNMPGEYFSDEEHLQEWLQAEKDETIFKEFLDKNIFSCKDFQGYIDKNGGEEKLKKLKKLELE